MRCPVCEDQDLVISSREGVEIDYCPQCRGVWLDRGELDKVIDRAGAVLTPPAADRARGDRPGFDDRPSSRLDDRGRDRDDDRGRDRDDDRGRARYEDDRRERPYDPRRHRRRSFLDDLFDFD